METRPLVLTKESRDARYREMLEDRAMELKEKLRKLDEDAAARTFTDEEKRQWNELSSDLQGVQQELRDKFRPGRL